MGEISKLIHTWRERTLKTLCWPSREPLCFKIDLREKRLYNWCQPFLGRQELSLLRWTLEYAAIKEEILAQFEISLEVSTIRLREMKNDAQNDPRDIVPEMKTLVKWWQIPSEDLLEDDKDKLKWLERKGDRTCDQSWLLNWNITDLNDMARQMEEYKLI